MWKVPKAGGVPTRITPLGNTRIDEHRLQFVVLVQHPPEWLDRGLARWVSPTCRVVRFSSRTPRTSSSCATCFVTAVLLIARLAAGGVETAAAGDLENDTKPRSRSIPPH